MVQIPQYNKSGVDDILSDAGSGSVRLPEGSYIGVFDKAELKSTKDGSGKYIAFDFRITQGQHADKVLVERVNVVNSNDRTVKIGFETLARIAKALGLDAIPSDTSALCGKLLSVEVKDEQGKPWTDREGNAREGGVKSVLDSRTYAPAPKLTPAADDLPDWAG